MLFSFLHESLIARVRDRIRSGEITERGLAKLTGLSQPHIHNALKGVRSLSTESADSIATHLGISIFNLVESEPVQNEVRDSARSFATSAPFLAGSVGPMQNLNIEAPPQRFYPLPTFAETCGSDLVWVTVGPDPELFPYFQDGDIALVGRALQAPSLIDPDSLYLIRTQNEILLRALRLAGTRLYLITPKTAQEPRLWTTLLLGARDLREIIFGKLLWLNRGSRPNPFDVP